MIVFASGMALLKASAASGLPTAAAWITAAAVPILIGVASILLVGIAAEAMVMQWLTYLERLSRAYARGRYSLRPKRLQSAPLEFRALGLAVADMAACVEHRDQALREALDEQAILLREVHHRVKNNLQIVGSLLSLQAARNPDPAIREALLEALVRIDAMSLTQRFLQPGEDADSVSSVELFEAFANQLRARLGRGRRTLRLEIDVAPRRLPADTGARLVLVAAEALIAALGGAHEGPLHCRLTLRFDAPDEALLTLATPEEPHAFDRTADKISRDLIDGYVRQLRGALKVEPASGELRLMAPL